MGVRQAPLLLALMLAACDGAPDEHPLMPGASAERGRAVAERVACASCHRIPGIEWPDGRLGPSLAGFADRGMIAGALPNRPDVLTAWVRNAPQLIPGTTMPAMPIDEKEAADIAAYLYTLDAD